MLFIDLLPLLITGSTNFEDANEYCFYALIDRQMEAGRGTFGHQNVDNVLDRWNLEVSFDYQYNPKFRFTIYRSKPVFVLNICT